MKRILTLFIGIAFPLHAADKDSRMAAPPVGAVTKLPGVPPRSPAEEQASFVAQDGFRVELIAAEPLVTSPVAMTYDENGRAYVCEMRDYPYTDKANHKPNQENPTDAPIGRVSLLTDADGDGVFDKSTVFADGLSWPTGVACWQGGVFVTATPDIWYFKDEDGDGRADTRRKVFSGFRKLNVQAVINSLAWGLDNRIHGAGSSNGGSITKPGAAAAAAVTMSRHDFRIDPRRETFELMSGGARFGGSFDDWGNRFLCNIRNPVQHVVLPARYLARNPSLPVRASVHDAAAFGDQLPVYRISPPEPWREIRAKRWAGDRDTTTPRSELTGGGVFTSTAGVTIYRGSAFAAKYRGAAFLGEVANNVVHVQRLAADGATFKAVPMFDKAEFIASTDIWFRPVNFINAPDGTLHLVDMYRENIEHPWSIPDDIHAAVDLENGRDMGRLWRITPPGFKSAPAPKLGAASAAELVAHLAHEHSWWRETAQRLIFERQDKSCVPTLRELARNGSSPQARLHALWSLHGLDSLTDGDIRGALNDKAAPVREHAVRLAEGRASLLDAVLQRAGDDDARVRFQTAFSLGEFEDARALDGLAKIAARDAEEPWIRTAVMSSVGDRSDDLLIRLLGAGPAPMLKDLAQIIGARGRAAEIRRVLGAMSAPWNEDVITGLGDGIKRSGRSLRKAGLDADTGKRVDEWLAAAAGSAADASLPAQTRAAHTRLLAYDDFARVKDTLGALLDLSEPPPVQSAAVEAVASFTQPDTASMLLANWRKRPPALRDQIMLAMLGGRYRLLPLLEAIEKGDVRAHEVPFARRALLMRHSDARVRELATTLFSGSAPGARKDVIEKFQRALTLSGDARRGAQVFLTAGCVACHRSGEQGLDIGPNLSTIRAWRPDQVLINILDPNREVAPNFVSHTIETRAGKSHFGIITEESAASISLKRADGQTETLLRSDIATLTSTGMSLMPEGIESLITVEQMADLIAHLLGR